jgi:hypothetical protein
MNSGQDENSDKADLTFSGEIPEGEFNRRFDIEANHEGLRIEDYFTVPWKWILQAREAIRAKVSDVPLPKDAVAESQNTES